MSDTMLFGVLRMPYELAMSTELSRRQFHDRAQQACDALEAMQADAERYHYLRNRSPESVLGVSGRLAGCWIDCDNDLGTDLVLLTGDDADAAIDAARGAK